MARIRTVKPEFWADEKLAPLDVTTRLVFLGLISMADDAGRVLDNLKQIDAFIFPETDDSAREALANLSRIARIRRGRTSSGQKVIQIAHWADHQRIDHPNLKSCLPEIVENSEDHDLRESLASHSREAREALAPRPVPVPTTEKIFAQTELARPRAPEAKPRELTDTEVEELYQLYPRKVGKAKAKKAIAKAVAVVMKGDLEHPPMGQPEAVQFLAEKIGAFACVVSSSEKRFIPHPGTWCNDTRFWDEERTNGSPPIPPDYVPPSQRRPRQRVNGEATA